MRAVVLVGLVVVLGGCSSFKPQALPDGSYRLRCSSTLGQCLHRAKKYCGDEKMHVLRKSDDELYGVPGHQTGAEGAEVHFRCGQQAEEPEWKLPPRRDQAPPRDAGPAKQPTRACTPGVTQRCVGPGACEGGQACLPDGSGFGPCDCGPDAEAPSDQPSVDAGLVDGAAGGAGPGYAEPKPEEP